ncbi:MAG TPA: F0F1 ATP synthase subunit epsilon [Ignavibacteriaceae bacterium]
MNELDLEIISPEKKVYTGKVKSVTIPGTKGNFQVLYNHAPLISTFEIGIIKLVLSDDSTRIFTTSGGSTEVLDNKVLILSDTVEPIESIDIERAKRAKERAEARLTKKEGIVDVDRARIALARALNRIKMSEKYSKD